MKNLLKALLAAQSELTDPVKNSTNPAFRNRYADLHAVLEAIEAPLAKNGLVITQTLRLDESLGDAPKTNEQVLVTCLWHVESAEVISSTMALRPEKPTPQGMGSAISYARRYSLQALLGLTAVDDDGQEASKPSQKPASKAISPAAAAVAKATNGTPVPTVMEVVGLMREAKTKEQLDRAAALASGLTDSDEKAEARSAYAEARKRIDV